DQRRWCARAAAIGRGHYYVGCSRHSWRAGDDTAGRVQRQARGQAGGAEIRRTVAGRNRIAEGCVDRAAGSQWAGDNRFGRTASCTEEDTAKDCIIPPSPGNLDLDVPLDVPNNVLSTVETTQAARTVQHATQYRIVDFKSL